MLASASAPAHSGAGSGSSVPHRTLLERTNVGRSASTKRPGEESDAIPPKPAQAIELGGSKEPAQTKDVGVSDPHNFDMEPRTRGVKPLTHDEEEWPGFE
jgi:hypothetical protein